MKEGAQLRVGFRSNSIAPDRLKYIRQLGVEDIFINPITPEGSESGDIFQDTSEQNRAQDRLVLAPDEIPTVSRLIEMRAQCAAEGIRLQGIHTLQYNMYGDIMFGRDGAERQLDSIKELLTRMGEADLPILGYQWNPRGVVPMRTGMSKVRGDAEATQFRLTDIDEPDAPILEREYKESELWANYESFIDQVVPVAELADVRMALHPVDPPNIPSIKGIPRLFRSTQSFERAMDMKPSDHHGLKLCLGCFSEMGEDIVEIVERFGKNNNIVFVHFRDVVGTAEDFHETFVDCGNFNERSAMQALERVGFDGIVIPDHVPNMIGDTDWGHRARGYTAGYLRGIIAGLNE